MSYRQTASGRWVPAKPPKSTPDGDDTELATLQASCRDALAAGVELPWWYPLMSFQAAVGRLVLEGDVSRETSQNRGPG